MKVPKMFLCTHLSHRKVTSLVFEKKIIGIFFEIVVRLAS